MERESRVALVTGSSRNIGRAIALRLASEGFRIVVHGKVNEPACQEVVKQVKKIGMDAFYVLADLGIRDEVERLAKEAHEPILEVVSQHATGDLERMLLELQDEGLSAEFAAHRGSPERAIVAAAAEKGADLIVMGTHGRTGLAHVLLGSVAERVVRTAPCPVITVKPS